MFREPKATNGIYQLREARKPVRDRAPIRCNRLQFGGWRIYVLTLSVNFYMTFFCIDLCYLFSSILVHFGAQNELKITKSDAKMVSQMRSSFGC